MKSGNKLDYANALSMLTDVLKQMIDVLKSGSKFCTNRYEKRESNADIHVRQGNSSVKAVSLRSKVAW